MQNLGLINRTIKTLIFGDVILQCNRDCMRDYANDLVHLMFDCPTEAGYEVHIEVKFAEQLHMIKI